MNYKLYEVGGKVRDELMRRQSDDVDYIVVVDETIPATEAFETLHSKLKEDGFIVFSMKQDHWTIRSKFPKDHPIYPKLTADFQLAVKDGFTCDLESNLAQRDFTINAMAKDVLTGEIVDPFDGKQHLKDRILHRVGFDTFTSDPIRVIRALRLSMTHQLRIGDDVIRGIGDLLSHHVKNIDSNRLQREVAKMFKYDTRLALVRMNDLYRWNFFVWNRVFEILRLNPIVNKGQ